MTKSSIFELNGKAYDALTGAMLGDAKRADDTVHVQSIKVQAAPQRHGLGSAASGASMDGMISAPRMAGSNHLQPRRQQPTKTLMRHAVAQPQQTIAQPRLTATGPANQVSIPVQTPIAPKLSSTAVDPLRAQRARAAGRSQSLDHFRPHRQATTLDYGRPRPQAQPMMQPAAQPAQTVSQPAVYQQPVQPIAQPAAQAPRPQPMLRRQAAAIPAAQPATQPRPQQKDEAAYEQDLFSDALAHATSHEEPAPKEKAVSALKRKGKKRKRLLVAAASAAVFLMLAGVIGLQNKENIQLQMASAKAGFSAAAPLYKPEGFEMDKLTYASGSVSQLYRSEKQSFTITQKKSNWDSQTLLDNFVATTNSEYQGFQSNGRTIYVYGNGNATWVNGGVWYQIKSTGIIPSEQLVKIAASI